MKVNRRTAVWGGAMAVVAVTVAAVAIAATTTAGGPKAVARTPTSSRPTISPSASPTVLPHVAVASGTIANWTVAPLTQLGAVSPEVGDAADGAVALSVDAPVVDKPILAASVSVPVKPGAAYNVSAKVRLLVAYPTAVGARLQFGPQTVPLPTLDANWTEVKARMSPGAARIVVGLEVSNPVLGLAVDDVRVVGADGVNVVPNPSFEAVEGASRIANESLVLSSATAAIAVALPRGEAQWRVTRVSTPVASGSLAASGGLQSIQLRGLAAGFLNFSVTDAAGVTTTSPIAVINRVAAPATLDPRFGVGTHMERNLYDSAPRYARSLGIANIRNDVTWAMNERTREVYAFAPAYMSGFPRLQANGINLLGVVDYGNKLYGNEKVPDNPEAVIAYGRYAAAIYKQFKPSALEVYNEFNMTRFNTGKCGTDPRCYMPLLTSVRDQVRAVDPNVSIVSGSTANYDAAWLNALWQDGGLAYSDVVSFHPYQATKDPDALAGIVADARAGMQRFGQTTRPIWITELGTPATPEWGTADEQATYTLKATVTALGSGVEKLYWYDLIDDTPNPHALESNFGLFGSPIDGVSALPPKPAAFAEALMIDQLQGKPAMPSSPLKEGVRSYKFGTGADSVTVAWATGGDTTVDYKTTKVVEVERADGQVATVKPEHGVAVVNIPTTGVFIHSAAASAK